MDYEALAALHAHLTRSLLTAERAVAERDAIIDVLEGRIAESDERIRELEGKVPPGSVWDHPESTSNGHAAEVSADV